MFGEEDRHEFHARPYARLPPRYCFARRRQCPFRRRRRPTRAQLIRLAEILGSLHYLRPLCGEKGDAWRKEMEALLQAEQPDSSHRAQLVASFNHGYRTFSETYGTCTSSAIAAIHRYMDEGEKLARDTATRFGN